MEQLRQYSNKVRYQTLKEANTAELIGYIFFNIIQYLSGILFGYIRQQSVNTYAQLLSTYPSPELGWTVLVKADETNSYKATLRQWNGSIWVNLDTALYEDDIALSGGSTKTLQEIDDSKAESGGSTRTLQQIDDSKAESGGSSKTLQQIDNFKLDKGQYLGTAQNLYDLIMSIEGGYNGIASIDIVNPIVRGYYISLTGGVFPNFGNIVVPEGYSILYFEDGHWAYQNITLNPNDPILDTDFF
ncbi:hypothetical protein LDB17_13285 [Dysgonomonas sp. Shenzhen-Wh21]